MTEGAQAKEALDLSRRQVAQLVNAEPEEIMFTASGSEGNNLALKGITSARQDKGRHVIVSAIEHVSVLNTARTLGRHGFEVTDVLPVDRQGLVDPAVVKAAIRQDTILVSVMAGEQRGRHDSAVRGNRRDLPPGRGRVPHRRGGRDAGVIPIDVRRGTWIA